MLPCSLADPSRDLARKDLESSDQLLDIVTIEFPHGIVLRTTFAWHGVMEVVIEAKGTKLIFDLTKSESSSVSEGM